jgi:hypothetical protein
VERVPQTAVVRHWLRLETAKDGPESGRSDDESPVDEPAASADDPVSVEELSDRAALDELLDRKPGAAAFLWRDAPVEWYRLGLTRAEFDALHVVEGPPDLGWRSLARDGTVRGAARRIDRGDPERLAATTGVDVPAVVSLAEQVPPATDHALVLSTRQGCVPWTVADGNHRAVAAALALRRGAAYEPRPAYLGVGANPVASPLWERLCGVARRVVSGLPAPLGGGGSRQ